MSGEPVISERKQVAVLAGSIGLRIYDRMIAAESKLAEQEARQPESEAFLAELTVTQGATIAQHAATIERLTKYKTAFETAREQILHTVGPMEVNDILTVMDEACEQAEMNPQAHEHEKHHREASSKAKEPK